MVSHRCKMKVKDELRKLGIKHCSLNLGHFEVLENLSLSQRQKLKKGLNKSGLELIENKKEILVEKIKNVIVEFIHYSENTPIENFSIYLSQTLRYDYTYLANVFSEVNGTSITQFIIVHKIERVKELMSEEELNLSEIAYKMNYSSVAALSNQFKKTTGSSPSSFKQLNNNVRFSLEDV